MIREFKNKKLISYIAPGAPATRKPATGKEPSLRLEIGFTPAWYRKRLDIDFGERFHTDPLYRRDAVVLMRRELKKSFGNMMIGGVKNPDDPTDILTGTYGACSIAAIYGLPILYSQNNWPTVKKQYMNNRQIRDLTTPDLDNNLHFNALMEQVDWIEQNHGAVKGFINWQGVLNNAFRLRGEELFMDIINEPKRAEHLFDCICSTMIEAITRLYERQRQSGIEYNFATISNCVVNMISPDQYSRLLLTYDRKIAEAFDVLGLHNCAWKADPYIDSYSTITNLGYIDMGINSDLAKAKAAFPNARRAIMYTPMDLVNKTSEEIKKDIEYIVRNYAPCDIVLADIGADTPDVRISEFVHMVEDCERN